MFLQPQEVVSTILIHMRDKETQHAARLVCKQWKHAMEASSLCPSCYYGFYFKVSIKARRQTETHNSGDSTDVFASTIALKNESLITFKREWTTASWSYKDAYHKEGKQFVADNAAFIQHIQTLFQITNNIGEEKLKVFEADWKCDFLYPSSKIMPRYPKQYENDLKVKWSERLEISTVGCVIQFIRKYELGDVSEKEEEDEEEEEEDDDDDDSNDVTESKEPKFKKRKTEETTMVPVEAHKLARLIRDIMLQSVSCIQEDSEEEQEDKEEEEDDEEEEGEEKTIR